MKNTRSSTVDVSIRGKGRGIALIAISIVLILGSLFTGTPVFAVIGAGFLIGAGVSILELRLSSHQLRHRSGQFIHDLSAHRPSAGESVTLTTTMPKASWMRSARGIRWQHCPPFDAGHVSSSSTEAAIDGSFRISTHIQGLRRGTWPLGELAGYRDDLLGLVRLDARIAMSDKLTVWPARHAAGPPGTGHAHAESSTVSKVAIHTHDDATLREYSIGDDLRRVHWPSSARHGDLLVKNTDSGDQGQLSVILLITAPGGNVSYAATEAAVTVAASILDSSHDDGLTARLAVPSSSRGHGQNAEYDLRAQLDHLSTVQPVDHHADLLPALADDLTAVSHNDHCALIIAGSLPQGTSQTLRSFSASAHSSAAIVITEEGESQSRTIQELSAASWRIITAGARNPRIELERLGTTWRS